ncbi:MAG: VWA domain-containing protein [Acidobacteria bacterium]|nr:VWA domain-containing protein [Acidobacteriota bacterium]
MKRSLTVLLLIVSLTLSLPFQIAAQDPAQDQKISLKTAEVILDVVVKDKKGRVVKDLTAADFEVNEDGQRQQIESFRLVKREKTTAEAPAAEKKEPAPAVAPKATNLAVGEPEIGVSAIAIVFDRLSQDGRTRARDAARSYVGENTRPDDYMGVFTIDLALKVIQNYTTDNRLIREAIDRAGASSSASFSSGAEQARSQNQRVSDLQQQVSSASSAAAAAGASGNAAAAGAAGSASGSASVDLRFAEMTRRTLETFEVLERDAQGYATSNGLLAVVNSMRNLPGRKAVVFFSEGLSIPPNVVAHFRSVINQANRLNVSIYTIDSAGLRAINPNDETRAEINALGRRRVDHDPSRPETGRPMTAMLERNEDLLKLNPQTGLIQLAAETGGAFIGDTSNIAGKLAQVDEDLHSYYLLTYSPTNQNVDGKFRQVSVKLKKGDYDVQTRKGYFAVNATGYVPMLYYESAALGALNTPNLTNAFPMRMMGFNFPDAAHKLRTVVEVAAPMNAFTFAENREKKTFATDFTVLALIKDQSKQVVAKLSRQYALTGPLDKVSATRAGQMLFYREAELPPGRYDIEAIAHDAPSGKASVQRSTIEIPDPDETKLRLSTISLIQRAEQAPASQNKDSFFQIGDVMIYPNLGEAFKKSTTKQMGFYFVVYLPKDLAKGSKPISEFTLQVTQGKTMVADFPLKLGAPDAQGRIAYASALPIDGLNPGTYVLKITVKDDQTSVTRSQTFTVEP